MTVTAPGTRSTAPNAVVIPQYSKRRVLGVWAMAALPMAFLAWVVTPIGAAVLGGPNATIRVGIPAITLGLAWQFVLVLWLVRREQGTLRWSVLREALWLRRPVSPKTGRRGGRLWWVLLPMAVLFAAEEFIPAGAAPGQPRLRRDPGLGGGSCPPRQQPGVAAAGGGDDGLQHRPR